MEAFSLEELFAFFSAYGFCFLFGSAVEVGKYVTKKFFKIKDFLNECEGNENG